MKYKLVFGTALLLCLGVIRDASAATATLQDYWNGDASFEFQYAIPAGAGNITSSCNPDSGEIVAFDGVWYRFSREFYNCNLPSVPARLNVEKSTDQGRAWTNKTTIINNDPGTPYGLRQ